MGVKGSKFVDIEFHVKHENLELMKKFLRKKPKQVNKIKAGHVPLLITAAVYDNVSAVEILLSLGADVSIQCSGGETALHFASFKGHYKLCKVLLNAGADWKIKDIKGLTALHHACTSDLASRTSIIGLFMKYGANFDEVCSRGMTVLHHASLLQHDDVCVQLLFAGHEHTIRDGLGRYPIDLITNIAKKKRVQSAIDHPYVRRRNFLVFLSRSGFLSARASGGNYNIVSAFFSNFDFRRYIASYL